MRRLRRPSNPEPSFFDAPRGRIDTPLAGSEHEGEVAQVLGWALFPGSTVARVEVTVGSDPPRPARLGMPRRDVAELSAHPSAPICGFEYMAELGEATGAITIAAVAHSADGRRVDLEPVTFVSRRRPAPGDDDGRAARLRARVERFARTARRSPDGTVRVLAFSHQLPYGGASLYLAEVLRRFVRKPGFECTVVTHQDGPLRDELESLGIEVHVTDPYPVMSPDSYEGSVAELTAWAAPQGFDVAFVNTLGSFLGADVAGRLGIPVVWGVHESFRLPLFWSTVYPPGHLHPYVRERAERAFGEAAAVIFEAEATRRLFLPNADADRLVTVPYGIELDAVRAARASYDRAEVRAALGLPPDARVALCLGTIEPRKSQAMLAEAFATIADRHPDVVLALVGRIDAEWCADYVWGLETFVARGGLAGRVRPEPVAANPLPWHVAADVHVCASDIESLPRSVLEAMAIGVPVVSTKVFGITEVIEDGVTGYLCEMRDSAGLADALDRALGAGAEERSRVAEAAARLVAIRHEPAGYADRLWNLLAALADDPAADVHAALGSAPGVAPLDALAHDLASG